MGGKHIMKKLTFATVLATATFLACGNAIAQQVLKVATHPLALRLRHCRGRRQDNYQTLDPSGTKAQGALIDLINAIGKDAGFQVQFVPVTVANSVAALTAKTVDIYANLTLDNKDKVAITDPLYSDTEALLVKKGETADFKTWDDLKGQVVAAQTNTNVVDPLQKSGLFKEVKLYDSGPAAGQAVIDGTAKGYFSTSIDCVFDKRSGRGRRRGIAYSWQNRYQARFPAPRGIGVNKDEADVLAKISASLAKLKANGTVQMLFAKYGRGVGAG